MDSYIQTSDNGVLLVGPDAVEFARVVLIRSAIKLRANGIIATRGLTITKLLQLANGITKKQYPRGPNGYALAIADLTTWIEAMKSALPVNPE